MALTRVCRHSCKPRCKPEHKTESLVLTDDYLRSGGYPEAVASRQLTRNYLDALFDSIIWKDVAKRYNVRNVTDLNNLAMYLVSNFCNPVSANELTNELEKNIWIISMNHTFSIICHATTINLS